MGAGERLAVNRDGEQELQGRCEELQHADRRIGQAPGSGGEQSSGVVETMPAATSSAVSVPSSRTSACRRRHATASQPSAIGNSNAVSIVSPASASTGTILRSSP